MKSRKNVKSAMGSALMDPLAAKGRPETIDRARRGMGWKTILFNCDCHTFHEVAAQLVKAIGCDFQRGLALANVIHLTGAATVFQGPRPRCESVGKVLEAIGLRVTVDQ
jgi:hypothetical protein